LALLDGPSASAFGELNLGFWVSQGNWKRANSIKTTSQGNWKTANSINIQKLEGIGWTATVALATTFKKLGHRIIFLGKKLREEGEKD
jgi:hypothetical protein